MLLHFNSYCSTRGKKEPWKHMRCPTIIFNCSLAYYCPAIFHSASVVPQFRFHLVEQYSQTSLQINKTIQEKESVDLSPGLGSKGEFLLGEITGKHHNHNRTQLRYCWIDEQNFHQNFKHYIVQSQVK